MALKMPYEDEKGNVYPEAYFTIHATRTEIKELRAFAKFAIWKDQTFYDASKASGKYHDPRHIVGFIEFQFDMPEFGQYFAPPVLQQAGICPADQIYTIVKQRHPFSKTDENGDPLYTDVIETLP
jgi:hypothetical protein